MEININLEDKTYPISTFGGEAEDICSYYGIQIDDLSFTITPETAVDLVKKLSEHLEINGRKVI